MYLNVYVPILQSEGGIAYDLREQRGAPMPSTALVAPMTRDFVEAIERFAAEEEIPLIRFKKGERKEDVAAEYRQELVGEGVVVIGKAQEKARVPRTERRTNPETGQPYPWLVLSTAMVNQ